MNLALAVFTVYFLRKDYPRSGSTVALALYTLLFAFRALTAALQYVCGKTNTTPLIATFVLFTNMDDTVFLLCIGLLTCRMFLDVMTIVFDADIR